MLGSVVRHRGRIMRATRSATCVPSSGDVSLATALLHYRIKRLGLPHRLTPDRNFHLCQVPPGLLGRH
jgi:hypothetical protein